jgi:hypothetical protein
MTFSEPARTTTRRIPRILVAGLLVVIAAIAAALGYQLLPSSSSTAASPIDVLRREHRGLRSEHGGLRSEHRGALGEADGVVPDGMTVWDDEIPGVANLDPDLLGALRQAATDAADDGVEFFVEVAGVPRSTRISFLRRFPSTDSKRKPPGGWPPRRRLLTCRGTRSTLGTSMPRRGCPSTAPSTGCARSTATSPGTTNCASRRSITVALPCTPTLRTIQGCSSDQHARQSAVVSTQSPKEVMHLSRPTSL